MFLRPGGFEPVGDWPHPQNNEHSPAFLASALPLPRSCVSRHVSSLAGTAVQVWSQRHTPGVKLAFCCAAKVAGALAPAKHFPHALLQRAERVYKAGASASAQPSRLQQEVSCRLWEMGVQHTTQHITPDGLFSVDIALHLQGCKVWAGRQCAVATTAD